MDSYSLPLLGSNMIKFMTFNEAMTIVSQYGYANKLDLSFIDTVSEMEDNIFDLTPNQRVALSVVIGEMDTMSEVM
jgi:hypothetical protein